MRPAHVYADLTPAQHRELVTALHGPWRVAARIVIVLLSASGMSAPEIAELLHYEPVTVRRWIARHTRDGIAGLPDRPRSGRPRRGSPRLGQRIHTLLQAPKAWTTARLWRAARRPEMSLRTFYRRLREQASWRRPRLIAKGDPDHDTTCAAIAARIAALPAGSVVLAEDETHLDLLPRVRSCWMPTGLRHQILTPGSNIRRTLHGAINLATGTWHHHVSVKNVSVVFCYFLQTLLDAYPDAPVVAVICDNGGTHHSGITRRWLTEHPRLMLIEGAKYSPQDNPVERIWAGLKHHIANTAPATMAGRVRQAHAYFRGRTTEQNLTTAAPWTSPWLPEGFGQDLWPGA
ncbi:IS630 family transposase [Lentzea aerocolonigenes]|uniref:IS630 family transposase n=7 Tax=Lentzea aerocolonigenes TaxID=68170 RepID=UPI0027DED5FD|nr:IS630 family transposase [Lentzea aerocolonigenes]MCP2250634.1 Transposase [Lentzea aerocolonigenes]